MGSYFGEDYTASALKRLATLTEDNLAASSIRQDLRRASHQSSNPSVRDNMRRQLQGVDLTQREVALPDALAKAIVTLRFRYGEESSERSTSPPAGRPLIA